VITKNVVFALSLLIAAASISGQDKPPQKIPIGVLDLEITGADANFGASMSDKLADLIGQAGSYEVFTQQTLEAAFAKVKLSFPARCREPRCVIDIGSATDMDRMVYGRLDRNEKYFGVQIYMLDVQTKQIIAVANLKGEPGVQAPDLLAAAAAKLHGKADNELAVKVGTYYGPEIHHERELAVASGACLGAGLIWALANGAFKSAGGDPPWKTDYANQSKSGISAGADRIPMSGRPGGLANCYLALSDDAYGVLYNPAGMAWTTGREAAISYQSRFGLLQNFSASYVNKATREIGFGQAFLYNGDNDTSVDMSEMYFISAIAYKFNHLLSFLRPVSAGASIKLGTKKASGNADATASEKTFGLGIDMGILWELSDQIRYGAVLGDVLGFDRVNNAEGGYSYTEMLPMTLTMGGLFKAGYTTNLVAKGQIPLYKDQPWKMAGGMEQEFFRIIRGRIGIEKQIQTLVDTPWKFTGGLGVNLGTESLVGRFLAVDASYEYNTLSLLYAMNISVRAGF
jgi:hypothetical protein